MSYYKETPSNLYTFLYYYCMWRTIQLKDIFVLIFNHSSNEEACEPADVPDNSVTQHGDNVFNAADISYHIDREVNAFDEVRHLAT